MVVKIEKVQSRIWAEIPYQNGTGPELAKLVPGARWNASNKVWAYPLSMAVCRELRNVFGRELLVGTALADWAREAVKREAAQIELRSATDATLQRVPEVAPALAAAMESRTYQRVGARFAADGRTVLIADEPGLGKTLETLAALVERDAKRVLVFCKKKAIETVWVPEAARWLGDGVTTYGVTGTALQRQKILGKFAEDCNKLDVPGYERMRIVIGNIEMVRRVKTELPCAECAYSENMKDCDVRDRHKWTEEAKYPELFEFEWDAIVVDESHKALIGKNVMSKNITQARLGMMRLPLAPGGMKIALSGTPWRGKTENAWGTLNWLNPKLFSSYWNWAKMYYEVGKNSYGGYEIGALRPEKIEAYDRMMAPYMLRRTKAEVAPDMPTKQYCGTPLDVQDPHSTIGVWLDLEPAQARRYKEIREAGAIKFENDETLLINGLLPELTRRKQFAICDWNLDGDSALVPANRQNSNKYQWLVEFVEERRDAGLKVVVASQFTKVVNAFSAWLAADGIESYTLTGETPEKRATANVAAFNDPSDKVPVFLLNTIAGGESINLDACADDIVFLDETFIPDDQLQAEDRIHRMSRIHQVNVWYLRSRGTVEEEICRTTGAREMITRGRLDGSRGVEALRRLLWEDGQKETAK